MTISTTTARTTYNGNGVTTVFPIPFRFLANGDIVVVSVNAVGVETTKALTTHYTLSGAGDDAGGQVTMLVAPANGTRLVIYRDTDIVQETDYISGDPFPAETHERALDRLTMIAQEIGSDADRAIKVPVGDSSSLSTTLPAAANRLDKFIVFDSTTGATELSTVTQTQVASAVAAAYSAGGSTADAVTFIQEGTGAVSRSIQSKARDSVSVADFGAVGDGVTDDTIAIQAALDAASGSVELHFLGKTYITDPLTIPSNSVIHLHPATVIKAKTGYAVGDRMVNITNVDNITIHGNGGKCLMLKAEYVSGEQRHGVFVTSATNVRIYDLGSDDAGGDGFYVGAVYTSGVPSRNILLKNCTANNNRRQGLSITGAVDMWVEGGEYSNTNGAAPEAGIDVEPNDGDTIQNVNIVNVKTSSNEGSGILVVPKGSGSVAGSYFSLNISGHESYNDVTVGGTTPEAALRFDNGAAPSNQINGIISVSNCRSYLCNSSGVSIGFYAWSNSPELVFDNVKITNPGTTATASTRSACGVSIGSSSATAISDNIKMNNVYCEDLRGTKLMYAPFYISSGAQIVTNLTMVDCDGVGYLLSDGPFVFVGTTTGSIVHQHKQREVSFAANTSVDRYAGLLLTQSVSSVLTLPTAAGRIGFEYEFWNSAGTTLQISPAAGDAILQLGLVTGEDLIIRTLGTRIKLQAVAANQWAVVELYGEIEPEGFLAPKRTVYQTAAPATRTWVVGDRCINSTPTVGQPKAWTCTVAGTPGTWVSEGVL